MATQGTDLTTAEGVKRLMDEAKARSEVVIFTGGETLSNVNPRPAYPGQLSEFDEVVISVLVASGSTWSMQTITLDAVDGAQGTALNGNVVAKLAEMSNGFRINFTGSSNQACISRIVGIRAGGGSDLLDLLARLLGEVA